MPTHVPVRMVYRVGKGGEHMMLGMQRLDGAHCGQDLLEPRPDPAQQHGDA